MGISITRRVVSLAAGLALAASLSATDVFARDVKTITAVEVQEEEGLTRLILRGADNPIYTAFLRQDPPRLIIELPDVTFKGIETPLRVQNGVVNNVTLAAFGDPRISPSMARISIGLERESEYELLPNGEELIVEVRPLPPHAAVPTVVAQVEAVPETPPAPQDTQEDAPTIEAATSQPDSGSVSGPSEPATPAASSTPATDEEKAIAPTVTKPAAKHTRSTSRIVGLVAEGEQIQIIADGPIDSVDAFRLQDPERIVADFWGAQNAVFPDKFTVDTGSIQRVRIGQHADKVRVVMDLRAPIVSHVVEPTKKGVRIVLQSEGAIAEDDEALADFDAIPAAPEEEPEASTPRTPPTPGQTVWVKSVHFESLPGVDRVVLGIDGELEARVVAPDPVTWVIDLPGSRILSEVERRVDTREFRGPLEMFSVFQTPDVPIHQVRVVLKRRGQSKPRLTWEESRLLIELPREGGTAFTPRATLPGEAPAVGPAPSSSAAGTQGSLGPVVGPPPTVLPSDAPALAPGRVPASPFGTDPLLAGPADPASIDILEEGGFDDEKTYQGRRISLDFKDADIANILRLIAEVSDLNIIAGDEVEGKVTLRLVDVPWDQSMDVILLTKGLGFVRVGNVLRIAALETLKLEKEARLMERRSKEKLEDLIVKLQPVNYASVKEMQGLIQRLLSPRGSVNVDERTNTLIIKDIPSVIHEATALVKAIDTQTPQVLIEAKIVEANLNFSRSLGANWGAGYNSASGSAGGAQDFHLADGALDAVIPVADGAQHTNFISSNPVLGALNGILTLGILGLDDRIQLDLQLMAAESNNRGKVISSPRIVTLDNREAVIKQGVAIKFTEITRDTVTTSFVDAVLELKVTPHITANRSIIMKLKVSRNAPQLSTASGDVVGITKNETETEALVRDGETMVLGGIYVVDNGKTTTKFPFLADIPLLGAAFRSNSIQDERRELLIFVTPRIVTSPSSDL